MPRCQQEELYAAESVVETGRAFGSVPELQAYVDGLRDTWWWEKWYGGVVYVECGKADGRGRCSVGGMLNDGVGRIEMLPVHMNERVVLHELAHVLAEYRYGSHTHCPWFARTYLELVNLVMGPEVYAHLYRRFTEAGIDMDVETVPSGIPL